MSTREERTARAIVVDAELEETCEQLMMASIFGMPRDEIKTLQLRGAELNVELANLIREGIDTDAAGIDAVNVDAILTNWPAGQTAKEITDEQWAEEDAEWAIYEAMKEEA